MWLSEGFWDKRDYLDYQVHPNSHHKCPRKRGRGKLDTGEYINVKMEPETGEMRLQANECRNHQKLEVARFSPKASREIVACLVT